MKLVPAINNFYIEKSKSTNKKWNILHVDLEQEID